MGRPCKCCEEVSSSSSSVCACNVFCTLATLCTPEEFTNKTGIERVQDCPCFGGNCTYDMKTGDWTVTFSNFVIPADIPTDGDLFPFLGECRILFNQKNFCGYYATNPVGLPDPTPRELQHGGVGSDFDPAVNPGADRFGTSCRVPPESENSDNSYCAREFHPDFDPANPGSSYLQTACGNNSGYACACLTGVEIRLDPGGGPGLPEGEECYYTHCALADGCDPGQKCLVVGDSELPTGGMDPCQCAIWSVTYKGTSIPPTPDNCRCWTFEFGGGLFAGYGCAGVCFYAESTPRCCGCEHEPDLKKCLGCDPVEIITNECPEETYPDQGGFQCVDGACTENDGISSLFGHMPATDPNEYEYCTYIAFGGKWYPVDSDNDCSKNKLPPCEASDGEIITIKKVIMRAK